MPHIITGEIKKAPYTKDGSNNNGRWKMYIVDLSERMKVRNPDTQADEVVYTNYKATFFAKENVMQWYDEAFQIGKVISITCDTLNLTSRDHNGTTYLTAEMIRPQLTFSQREAQQQGWGQPQQPQGNQQQPQRQQRPQQQPPQQGNQFDDDIPF